jgi:CRISPR-associated protein Cmr1
MNPACAAHCWISANTFSANNPKENSMHTLTATYRIVTPMFLGDAEQKATEIRPPSVKGALRFWWRALNWGRFRNGTDDATALQNLHEAEAELFGAAADEKNNKLGQSQFLIQIMPARRSKESAWPRNQTPSGYLGLGLFSMPGHPQREGFMEQQDFTVTLRFKPGTDERIDKNEIQVRDALTALSLFGGLGSRARRGFGSVALITLDGIPHSIKTKKDYASQLSELLSRYPKTESLPPFTAFSTQSRLALFATAQSARQAHEKFGRAYQQYRGQPSKLRGRIKAGFGLPLTGVSPDRRASPLLMHIHPVGGAFQAGTLYMPSVFHPKWDKVHDYVVEDFLKNNESITL